ncbi:MAG: ring-cleaving dioxygenase [Halobacteria archaeon]|nr:ring-cleaving dioxygenase [Halobacteria archaeon]
MTSKLTTSGLHHVTVTAGDPKPNAEFYVNTVGLRFVKRTVNHDDTDIYHFYFGDRKGTPGTNISFFPLLANRLPGRNGAGQAETVAYVIPSDSVGYWEERLESKGVKVDHIERFGDPVLDFTDPDGVSLEFVASDTETDAEPWEGSPVPVEHQLRGFHSVTLAVEEFGPTVSVLTDVLGYSLEDESGGRRRYSTQDDGMGSVVDVVETDDESGRMGIGVVQHVAFRASDDGELEEFRDAFADHGLNVTRKVDRKYFNSIYCREPGGILFEVATEDPGFTVDEDVKSLGSRLVLPDWLEDRRDVIEERLPEFEFDPNLPTDGSS